MYQIRENKNTVHFTVMRLHLTYPHPKVIESDRQDAIPFFSF